ncbi:hypothetical protein BST81_19445 [Leptolyngbya sp. 'hensonii']|uniref:sensor histidine kinase n=1 Tax=Leptolyngbya sp. 'hensonii' TaxID=1922337 RepID=UPI00094F619D|nr:HAMP domain-containing sensor histidine kinase [Leptolyngbya sp. 'hensonii']OLP16869.1 hypothetical protein BST81_19445 [Leptolyngbya sp. 'hensonii']
MDWINLPSLLIGLGLGVVMSQLRRSNRQALVLPAPTADAAVLRLQEQLKQTELAYQMAAMMSQFKAGFLARTSHELRSPLNSLIGSHQLILSDLCDDPAEEREFIAQAHGAALKMMNLIDRILEVAKLEHGTQQMEIEPVSLLQVLQEIQQLTCLQAQNRNLRLQVVMPETEVYVLADLRRLTQVLLTLVDTPISLMQEGKITVSTIVDPTSKQVHILVEDQRPSESWQEPIDLLQHGPSERGIVGNLSSGMQLQMSQLLMELMQGRLEILATPIREALTNAEPGLTQIQCSVPLVVLEPE